MHYAWSARLSSGSWEWDKHKYQTFRAEACPQGPGRGTQGLFPHPPMPSELTSRVCSALTAPFLGSHLYLEKFRPHMYHACDILELPVAASSTQRAVCHLKYIRDKRQQWCLMTSIEQGGDLIKDLLNIEVVASLNQAFCKLHHSLEHCSNTAYAHTECAKVVGPASAWCFLMR